MNDVKKVCLSCRYFRLEQIGKGLCRVEKDRTRRYPDKSPDDHCQKWQNCGQQYFIRMGWLKAQTRAAEEVDGKENVS